MAGMNGQFSSFALLIVIHFYSLIYLMHLLFFPVFCLCLPLERRHMILSFGIAKCRIYWWFKQECIFVQMKDTMKTSLAHQQAYGLYSVSSVYYLRYLWVCRLERWSRRKTLCAYTMDRTVVITPVLLFFCGLCKLFFVLFLSLICWIFLVY